MKWEAVGGRSGVAVRGTAARAAYEHHLAAARRALQRAGEHDARLAGTLVNAALR